MVKIIFETSFSSVSTSELVPFMINRHSYWYGIFSFIASIWFASFRIHLSHHFLSIVDG